MSNMRWDLTPLYPSFDSKELADDKQRIEKLLDETAKWFKETSPAGNNLKENLEHMIKTASEIYSIAVKLTSYTQLTLSADANNKEALSMMYRLENLEVKLADISKAEIRFVGKVKNLQSVIDSSDILKEHEFYLKELARQAAHLLGENIEPVISRLEVTGAKAWSNLRRMIDGTLQVDIEIDGEMKSLPMPVVRNMAYDPDANVRKKAYHAELAAYKKVEVPLAMALNSIKGESNTMCGLRGYKDLEYSTLENSRMDKRTLEAMLSAMVDYLPEFRRYLKAKAKLLGHKDKIPFYDLFAPLGGESTKKYSYDQARQFLVKSFSGFSTEMSEFIDNAFEDNWIDAEPRPGKRGGAFCANLIPIKQSRVFANFNGSFSQVSTLAHELGHAWHGHCLQGNAILNTRYPMPLAETASIFNECYIVDTAKKTATEDDRFILIESDLMQATQVIVDIYARYLFETEVVNTRLERGMSIPELNDAMIRAQKATYGDALDEEYMHEYMWASKPHYYERDRAYYNWPYAFGLLFGKGVFGKYKTVGKSFINEYKELLRATGSNNVVDVAKRMHIDLHDKAFWEQSLNEIKNDVDEFCALAEKRK